MNSIVLFSIPKTIKSLMLVMLCLILGNGMVQAQTGMIRGRVLDDKNEPAIGATISVEGLGKGAKSNIDGYFVIKQLGDGVYTLVVTYVSCKLKKLEKIKVDNGISDSVIVRLEKEIKDLKEVQIKTTMKKESIQALFAHQKNLSTISDGISAEMIKKTSDRSTGEILKRVSGVTIVDNKYAVIRGLADRYNLAMLNGDVLPSSESDKKAFSFDVFPSALVDRISIVKTASPDKPSEFAGGIIDVTSRDIPNDNFVTVQIGSGGNSLATFKERTTSVRSNTDWLGFDHSTRVLPSNFPTTAQFLSSSSSFSKAQRLEASKSLKNNWALSQQTTPLNQSLGITGGYTKKFKKDMKLGAIAALSYNRSYRSNPIERTDVSGTEVLYNYNDTSYKENTLIGALVNFGFKINDNHKLQFRNTYTSSSENQTILRGGNNMETQQDVLSNAAWYSSNQLLSNGLQGEHILGKREIKLQWGINNQSIHRNLPDLRKYYSLKNYDDSVYRAYIPQKASPFYSGTFYASTKEVVQTGNADISFPYILGKQKQQLKGGFYYQQKNRNYHARVLGFRITNQSMYNSSIELLPQETLFSSANMSDKGMVIEDITQPSDQYTAESKLTAGYLMNETKIKELWRFTYGFRMEKFTQHLVTGFTKVNDKIIDKESQNILPSLNATYSPNKKVNVRFCVSQTLSRPEFRELAPAAFYNYNLLLTYIGNEKLEQTKIMNYDLRYEYFMGKGEMVSASVFYKKFDQPIEAIMDLSTKLMSYSNTPNAYLYGAEVEFRKTLGFLTSHKRSILHDLTVFGNLSYIKSEVTIEYPNLNGEVLHLNRRMQGQSPYIINLGAGYTHPESNLSITATYNRIGERIFAVGNQTFVPDLYEAPRNLLDIQFSKKFKNSVEIKLSIGDLLANPMVYYYNAADGKTKVETLSYQKNTDINFSRQQQGRNLSISIGYTF